MIAPSHKPVVLSFSRCQKTRPPSVVIRRTGRLRTGSATTPPVPDDLASANAAPPITGFQSFTAATAMRTVCNRATCPSTPEWYGRAQTGPRACLSGSHDVPSKRPIASFADALRNGFYRQMWLRICRNGHFPHRLRFQDLWSPQAVSEAGRRAFSCSFDRSTFYFIRMVWRHCGSGLGIDTSRGGMRLRAMLHNRPDFFVHCGDLTRTVLCPHNKSCRAARRGEMS